MIKGLSCSSLRQILLFRSIRATSKSAHTTRKLYSSTYHRAFPSSIDRINSSINTSSSSTSTSTIIGNVPTAFTGSQNTIRQFAVSLPDKLKIDGVPDDVAQMIQRHASRSQTSASLKILMDTGRGKLLPDEGDEHEATNKILMQVAGFLRHELPIRLAHRILDLERVPLMKEMPSVKAVRDLYVTSFLELLSVQKQIDDIQQEEAFARILESVYERHSSVLVQMARGAFELRAALRNGKLPHKTLKQSMVQFDSMEDTHAFLDRFYVSRIG
jgi:hypothetical protein